MDLAQRSGEMEFSLYVREGDALVEGVTQLKYLGRTLYQTYYDWYWYGGMSSGCGSSGGELERFCGEKGLTSRYRQCSIGRWYRMFHYLYQSSGYYSKQCRICWKGRKPIF